MRWFWIDRFTEFVSGERATAIKNVSLAEEHLHDHVPGYPIMPSSLVTEGMAQTAGLLVSEHYAFQELVVLGKIARAEFHRDARPGDTLTYKATIEQIREGGAVVRVTSHLGPTPQGEAEIFFARLDDASMAAQRQLFDPADLLHWLSIVGVFDVGQRPDGTRLTPSMYATLAV